MGDSGRDGGKGLRAKKTIILILCCAVVVSIVASLGSWYFLFRSTESESPPTLDLLRDSSGLVFTVNNSAKYSVVSWSDVLIKLEARPTNANASYSYDYWEWHPNAQNLTNSAGQITASLNATTTPAHMIVCNLTDLKGNGYVDDGDQFTLALLGSDVSLSGVPCEVMLIYKVSADTMGGLEFTP